MALIPSSNFSRRATRLLSGFLALLLTCSTAFAGGSWWNDAWTARRKITVDATPAAAGITDPIGGATVLLRLHDESYPTAAKEDLSDLRFVAADHKTVLPHHVEKVDAVMSEAFVWVKLPDVKPNEKTDFWMYFGSGDAKAVKSDDAKGSYDKDTALVIHFADGAAAGDVTENGGTIESTAAASTGSCIGSGASFNGRNAVNITPSPALLWSDNAPMTLTAWVKVAAQQDAVILSRRDGAKSFVLGATKGVPFVEIDGQRAVAAASLAPGSWAHIALVCDGAKTTLCVNGERIATLPAGLPGMNSPIVLGGTPGFAGELDELQIHKVARPLGFIQLAAFGQNGEKAARVVAIGATEEQTNLLSWLSSGTFGIIIKNLTADGWAVIVILAIMAVLSWYVMVNKVRYLNGVSTGNHMFLEQWRHVAADLTELDDGDEEKTKSLGGRVTKENAKTIKKSSVYRIYRIGVDEIRQRIAADRLNGLRRGLAGRSIQAVRASLDGGLVRETQQLNKLIVLLTICISGGPFLGLLGTVVGVMITFAAVAAAGEVNVAAIAPGIAAALLATVAGLAVAIPSLFGYNYILSRVKDAKDDMHVFIDEFVTRMAEFHKEQN